MNSDLNKITRTNTYVIVANILSTCCSELITVATMDIESANKPCCSKSLHPLKDHQKEHSSELIVVEDEDSNDSAYETGSSLSRSCQSSPTCKLNNKRSYLSTKR